MHISNPASKLVEHASSKHDNPSPLCSLYKKDSLDPYVPFFTSFSMSRSVSSPVLVSTVLTLHFLVSVQDKRFLKKSGI